MDESAQFFKICGSTHAALDVIFVHGLTGDPIDTWSTGPTKDCWPKWLCATFDNVNVYSMGYPCSIYEKWAKKEMNLHERANSMLEKLASYGIGERPNFGDNSILVDGELNFAESSNVIVKNSAILALLLSAAKDAQFFHPRFALFDNIEDKGMEQDRSHNFQDLIVQASEAARLPHQIILTTSMLNPQLDDPKFVIGPHYTHQNRTLSPNRPASETTSTMPLLPPES